MIDWRFFAKKDLPGGRACALILSRSESGRPYKHIKGPPLAQPPPLHRAAAADGALTGRQRGVSRALFGPQRLTAPARATACCAAAPPRGCCSQWRSDGPLLAEQRRPEGAARAGRPCGRHHAGTSSASTGRVQVVAVERACVATSRARSGACGCGHAARDRGSGHGNGGNCGETSSSTASTRPRSLVRSSVLCVLRAR